MEMKRHKQHKQKQQLPMQSSRFHCGDCGCAAVTTGSGCTGSFLLWRRVFLAGVVLNIVVVVLIHSVLNSQEFQVAHRTESKQHRYPQSNKIVMRKSIGKVDSVDSARLKDMERSWNFELRSCRWRPIRHDDRHESSSSDAGFYGLNDTCDVSNASMIHYFNPGSVERIFCGSSIKGGEWLNRTEPCHHELSLSRMFHVIPDNSAKGVPIVSSYFSLWEGVDNVGELFKDCDIPCWSRGRAPTIDATRYIDRTPWKLTFSMEGPRYYRHLNIDPNAYLHNRFYSTTSYKSDVPLPYFSWNEYNIKTPEVEYDRAFKGALFLAKNCHSMNNRERIVQKLINNSIFRIDSLSKCLKNKDPPPGVDLSNKKQVMSHYLFYLAFENQNVPDYITEKLFGALEAGTVPVYFGAPNIKEHVPYHSIINVADFNGDIDRLAMHLFEVANNKTLYQAYHSWRTQPLPPHFHAKYDFTHFHSTCRTCRWAHAKLYGLGWDHNNQSLRPLRLPRTACLDTYRRLHQPIAESWWSSSSSLLNSTKLSRPSLEVLPVLEHDQENRGNNGCRTVNDENRALTVGESSLERRIWEKDGVIDLLIQSELYEGRQKIYEMKLATSLKQAQRALIARGHVRIQTNETRITFLTLPRATIQSTAAISGTNDEVSSLIIPIRSHQLPLRIRIIVEDIDTVHPGANHVENYFGGRMIEDFYNPIEAFVLA